MAPQSQVKHSTTEPLRFPITHLNPCRVFFQDFSHIPFYHNRLFYNLKWKSLPQKLRDERVSTKMAGINCKRKIPFEVDVLEEFLFG